MGKASKAKRERRLCAASSAHLIPSQKALDQLRQIPAAQDGARFQIKVGGNAVGGHELLIACVWKDEPNSLEKLEALAQQHGCSCLDLLYTHPTAGYQIDALALAVILRAKACLPVLTVMAYLQEREEMLAKHLNRLLLIVKRDDGDPISEFARDHLKDHFARTRKRGAENIKNMIDYASEVGCGESAKSLLGEIEAEELAAREAREFEKLVAPAPGPRSSVRAL